MSYSRRIYVSDTSFIQQWFPESNLVTVSYDDISATFDNKEVYEIVEEGDTIQVVLHQTYDKNGNLKKRSLDML